MKNNSQKLYALEQLSFGGTCIHRLNPVIKLVATAVYIITVVSFDRYAFGRLIPFIFYPTLLISLSDTPYLVLLKRLLIAIPFCLFAGITNVIFNRTSAFVLNGIVISYGVVSLFTILLRTYLCVMTVLLLVSVTPLSDLTGAMRRLKIPYIFVALLEMTYRYIGVLFEEAYSMHIAYTLRSASVKGIEMRDMGSFIGVLLLRSIDRAERVYNAMKCRGYALHSFPRRIYKFSWQDFTFIAFTCSLCITFRFIDINLLFAKMFGGII